MYFVYFHHSGNSIGIFAENERNEIVFKDVVSGKTGYLTPLLIATKNALDVIPENAPLIISSPIVRSLTTSDGKKQDSDLRRCVRDVLSLRQVSYNEIAPCHPKAIKAKELVIEKLGVNHKRDNVQNDIINSLPPDYIAYTDGSCNNLSPYGEGGAAYVILDTKDNIIKQNSKGFLGTTNNRMELLAIVSAVASIPTGSTLKIYTDSQYCIQVLKNVANANNFTRPNSDVIRQYFKYASQLKQVQFEWVKGHNGDKYNELCDSLADSRTEEMRTLHNIPLYDIGNSPKIKR